MAATPLGSSREMCRRLSSAHREIPSKGSAPAARTRRAVETASVPRTRGSAGGARSVMHSYTDTDGVPAAADESLLTGLLRDTWGFDGTVVADYFGIDVKEFYQ